VALASVAYAVGSESGDGSAVADSFPTHPAGDRLADALGVDSSELRKALRDFHEQHARERRDDFTNRLAQALDKSADEVRAALDGLADKRHTRFSRQLAEQLGIDEAKVRSALDELRDERPHGPFGFAAALAGKLGVDPADVEDALRALRPEPPLHRHHGREPLRELASALEVTRGELREALRELRAEVESTLEQGRAELVAFLADRFGLSEAEVEKALPEFPRPPHRLKGPDGPGFRHGPDFRRGPVRPDLPAMPAAMVLPG
jgi:transcription initiation factor IIE alpha subunit